MFIYQFKELPLVFIFNEKCACTTIKNIINDIDKLYENDEIKDEKKRFFFAHNNPNSIFQNVTIYDILKNKTHHVIFFMRNPYHRFLSGYTKIRYKSRILQRIDKSKKREECLELIKNYNINVDEWGEIISQIEHKNIEPHFKPQTYNIENIFNYDKLTLYDIEQLSNLNEYVKEHFDIDLNCNIHEKYDLKKSKPTQKTIDSVYEYYKQDFELLHYDKEFKL